MSRAIVFVLCMQFLLPLFSMAEDRTFLGTKTGWARANETFFAGRYKRYDLFLVIGFNPTKEALREIRSWKSKTTYVEDLQRGKEFFGDQMVGLIASVPNNIKTMGVDTCRLVSDPADEFRDLNLISPASILFKTTVNLLKIGWDGIRVFGEPIVRAGTGAIVLACSPCIKPVTYTSVLLIYSCTAVYGLGSSAVGGAVMLTATGAVFSLDVSTSPFVAIYGLYHE